VATVYLETSIPSYLAASPSRDIVVLSHQELTRTWWNEERKDHDLFISEIVLDEISRGDPEFVEKRLQEIREVEVLILKKGIEKLTEKYMSKYNFPDKLLNDMLHIAFAVYYEDFLLTWNCKHIGNAYFKNQLARYNTIIGYETPAICTPEELIRFYY
jgi:predicted nucleic acid-binding protein